MDKSGNFIAITFLIFLAGGALAANYSYTTTIQVTSSIDSNISIDGNTYYIASGASLNIPINKTIPEYCPNKEIQWQTDFNYLNKLFKDLNYAALDMNDVNAGINCRGTNFEQLNQKIQDMIFNITTTTTTLKDTALTPESMRTELDNSYTRMLTDLNGMVALYMLPMQDCITERSDLNGKLLSAQYSTAQCRNDANFLAFKASELEQGNTALLWALMIFGAIFAAVFIFEVMPPLKKGQRVVKTDLKTEEVKK